jgi:acetyltransferase-like isoleucine patch superfamily enzyme
MNKLIFIFQNPLVAVKSFVVKYIPYFKFIYQTRNYQCNINFDFWFSQKVLNKGGNKNVYWPVHPTSKIVFPENILVGIDAYPGIMGGCYIQGFGGISIGDYSQIAPNVVIVSANHNVYDSRKHIFKKVSIGKYCWLGAGCKILPGVTLGDFTIVGAGAVVTKSFHEGYCIIAGNPAKKIKELEKSECVHYELYPKYNGYIASKNFKEFRKNNLKV